MVKETGSDFNWYSSEDEDSVVIRQVEATAVYVNPAKDIVIRQRNPMGEDDSVIVIPRQHVPALIEAIKQRLAESG